MRSAELIRRLRRAGCELVRQRGSHVVLVDEDVRPHSAAAG